MPGSCTEIVYGPDNPDRSFVDKAKDLWLTRSTACGIRVPSEAVAEPDGAAQAAADKAWAPTPTASRCPRRSSRPQGRPGPYETGDLFGAAAVFFFVLCIGAFITVTMRTGALDAGIERVTHRFRARGAVLIVILMVIFSLGGTTYGMAEETLGFYALLVPIMVGLGFDRMVGAVTIMVGAGVGTLASTVNPFATGVASDAGRDPARRRHRAAAAHVRRAHGRGDPLRAALRPEGEEGPDQEPGRGPGGTRARARSTPWTRPRSRSRSP